MVMFSDRVSRRFDLARDLSKKELMDGLRPPNLRDHDSMRCRCEKCLLLRCLGIPFDVAPNISSILALSMVSMYGVFNNGGRCRVAGQDTAFFFGFSLAGCCQRLASIFQFCALS